MFTMKLFDGLVGNKNGMTEQELKTWARLEYRNDAEYAYTYMKEYGKMPQMGGKVHA